jgi:steroid delta-isomerase-like uncharacterized protein
MSALDAAKRYFDAWNRRSPGDIVASIQSGGTYEDPLTGGPLSGSAIAQYAGGLFEAFPDLSFEIVSAAETGPNSVAAQWVMRGTNTGPMNGAPPTGRTVVLPGADFIATNGNLVASVKGYFDTAEVPRQLGMQVIVQPTSIGPVQFGYSVYMATGKRTRPGAFSITSLRIRSEAEVEKVQNYSQRIMQEMPGMRGFISAVTGRAGSHMFTVTAWESPDDIRQMRGGAHQEAMDGFFGPDFTHGGVTSVWTPHRLNAVWVRCGECGEMSATQGSGSTCRSGHTLPDPPPYW